MEPSDGTTMKKRKIQIKRFQHAIGIHRKLHSNTKNTPSFSLFMGHYQDRLENGYNKFKRIKFIYDMFSDRVKLELSNKHKSTNLSN
jgi:hypothetical protein